MARTEESIDKTFAKINRLVAKTPEQKALLKAGLFVQRKAQKLTPVKTGNLKASARTRMVGRRRVRIAFLSSYAIFVHEGFYKHRVGERKFLQNAVRRNKKKIVEIIGKSFRDEMGRSV